MTEHFLDRLKRYPSLYEVRRAAVPERVEVQPLIDSREPDVVLESTARPVRVDAVPARTWEERAVAVLTGRFPRSGQASDGRESRTQQRD